MQPPGKTPYLLNLQILRCLAALMVLLNHLERETASGRVPGMAPVHDPTGIVWASGVDVFFVVSGFIMYHLTWRRFGQPGYPAEFLKRRFIRIVPLYWIFTTLMLVAVRFARGEVHHADATWDRAVLSYLFFPAMRADGAAVPVLAIGWTLNLEVLFYLAYAACLRAPKRTGLALLFLGFLAVAAFGGQLSPILAPFSFWSLPIILEFPMGVALAMLFKDRGLRIGRGAQVGGAILALAVMWALDRWCFGLPGLIAVQDTPPDWCRWLWGGAPALLLGAALMLGPEVGGRTGRVLAAGGDASYALYLSHPFAMTALSLAWNRLAIGANGWAYVVAGLIVCIAFAVVVHRLVEAPILALLRRWWDPVRAAVPG
jgi:peptidoglycan/LPS O-acetylase OafA/YrhL